MWCSQKVVFWGSSETIVALVGQVGKCLQFYIFWNSRIRSFCSKAGWTWTILSLQNSAFERPSKRWKLGCCFWLICFLGLLDLPFACLDSSLAYLEEHLLAPNLLIFVPLESTLNLHIKLCVKAPELNWGCGHFPRKVRKFQNWSGYTQNCVISFFDKSGQPKASWAKLKIHCTFVLAPGTNA